MIIMTIEGHDFHGSADRVRMLRVREPVFLLHGAVLILVHTGVHAEGYGRNGQNMSNHVRVFSLHISKASKIGGTARVDIRYGYRINRGQQ